VVGEKFYWREQLQELVGTRRWGEGGGYFFGPEKTFLRFLSFFCFFFFFFWTALVKSRLRGGGQFWFLGSIAHKFDPAGETFSEIASCVKDCGHFVGANFSPQGELWKPRGAESQRKDSLDPPGLHPPPPGSQKSPDPFMHDFGEKNLATVGSRKKQLAAGQDLKCKVASE
jgi:hypothetical protein